MTSLQPATSVAIATGFSPTLMLFLPGVSGFASSTVTSPPENAVDGLVGQCAIATVPGSLCRMNATQSASGTIGALAVLGVELSWPGAVGVGVSRSWAWLRVSQPAVGCALTVTVSSAVGGSRRS